MPLPIVAAILSSKIHIAMKLKNAAMQTACIGVNVPVATTVAMLFAASWNPLVKSNTRATATNMMTASNIVDMITSILLLFTSLCLVHLQLLQKLLDSNRP